MISIITGALIISILHAVIPNHWLPVIAIGKKEKWTLKKVTKVTFSCALAHGLSTVAIGFILAFIGAELNDNIKFFTSIIAPVILVLIGIIYIYRHHRHKHFHIADNIKKRQKKSAVITALVVVMFFSPCLEIEAYFLLAGTKAAWLVWITALLYLIITITGMLLLVSYAYKGILKMNWHSLEHNAGMITGYTLIITGILSYFIK